MFAPLMIAACVAAAPPAPLFEKCDILGPEAGADRTLSCPGGTAFATRDGPKVGAEPLIELMKSALGQGGAAPKYVEVEITLEGTSHRALRYTLAGKTAGVIAVVPAPGEDRVRGIGCESTDAAWCHAVMASLARALPEPNKENPAAAEARRLAGRTVEIPPGCSEKAPGLVTCPKHSFSFMNAQPGDPTDLDAMAKSLRVGLAEMGAVGEAHRPCTVEGAKTTCRVFTIQRPDKRQLFVVAAFADLPEKKRVYVQCNSSEGLEPLPPACRPSIVLLETTRAPSQNAPR